LLGAPFLPVLRRQAEPSSVPPPASRQSGSVLDSSLFLRRKGLFYLFVTVPGLSSVFDFLVLFLPHDCFGGRLPAEIFSVPDFLPFFSLFRSAFPFLFPLFPHIYRSRPLPPTVIVQASDSRPFFPHERCCFFLLLCFSPHYLSNPRAFGSRRPFSFLLLVLRYLFFHASFFSTFFCIPETYFCPFFLTLLA